MDEQKRQLVNRLKRIEGHLNGVIRMVENEKDEEDLLIQMLAVQGAVKKVCAILIEGKTKTLLSKSVDKSMQANQDACKGCSHYQELTETLEQMEYEELVAFVMRYMNV